MKFMIAGLGSIGRRHLRNLKALGEEDIVLYRSGRSTLPDDELTGHIAEIELDAALAHKPDAVIVSNPTALHLDVAIPAAEAGCNLLIEKPISHNLERVDELLAAVKRGGGKVLVGYQFRFHPGLQAVKRWLIEGRIGKPISAYAHWGEYLPDWHPWEDYRQSYAARRDLGGGVVLTLCHPFDYLRWLMGEVVSVTSWTGQVGELDLEVEDIVEAILEFDSGAVGHVHLDYLQRPPEHRLEIIGTEGTIRWDNANGYARIYRSAEGQWESSALPDGYNRNALFIAEMKHFIDAASGDAESGCPLDDGIRSLRVALAVLLSEKGELNTKY
jgi:predicted dehydrogenase